MVGDGHSMTTKKIMGKQMWPSNQVLIPPLAKKGSHIANLETCHILV